MRKVSDYPLVFVNNDDVAIIANGQVMCVDGSASDAADKMVRVCLDNERAVDVRGVRRRALAIMGAFAVLVPFTQGSFIAWMSSVMSGFMVSIALAALVVSAFMLFAFAINDYIRPEHVPEMEPDGEFAALSWMLPDEADNVDDSARNEILSAFRS